MGHILILMGLGLEPIQPINDIHRFPNYHIPPRQVELYTQHLNYLRYQRTVLGFQDGRWDVWIEESEYYLWYWERLSDVYYEYNQPGWLRGMRALARFRKELGDDLYYWKDSGRWRWVFGKWKFVVSKEAWSPPVLEDFTVVMPYSP